VTITRTTLEIELPDGIAGENQDRILTIPWTPPSPYRRREIIQGEDDQSSAIRPMRTKARAILIDALRDAQSWLAELTTGSGGGVMSGRRSLIKGYFWRCAGRGVRSCLRPFARTIGSAGPDVVR
jgi:hypothetical protein